MSDSLQPVLSVQDLHTYYHQDEGIVRAVDGATFDVYPGKTLGIVGESGCGKSVTARSILRIIERGGRIESGAIRLRRDPQSNGGPTAGSRQVDEIDLTRLDSDGRLMRSIRGGDIALIFQEPMTSLSAFYTVGNQIIEGIRLHSKMSKSEARDRAVELLRLVGIPRPEQRVDDYSFQLSGGLRQRVMIAMALASDPKILIADEPTTALDVTTQAQILDLLRQLQEEKGLSILLITHDMGVIAEMADDVAVMYLGRVVERGTVEQIFHAPQHPYTQALLKSIPSILAEPRTKLATIHGSIPHPYSRPVGCPFHPRCPEFMDGVCNQVDPQLLPLQAAEVTPAEGVTIEVGDTRHLVSCFLHHPPAETLTGAAAETATGTATDTDQSRVTTART